MQIDTGQVDVFKNLLRNTCYVDGRPTRRLLELEDFRGDAVALDVHRTEILEQMIEARWRSLKQAIDCRTATRTPRRWLKMFVRTTSPIT